MERVQGRVGRLGVDVRRLGIVARFELAEALRSRLVTVVIVLYGAGAAIGAYVFGKALDAAEAAVRDSLGTMNAHAPADLVREHALPRVIAFLVEDEALERELLSVEPLAIFYGFMALTFVAPMVLVTSGSVHAGDLHSGAARFVLSRCDRLSWALGKALGHAGLLALGVSIGALATLGVAYGRGGVEASSVLWLLRAAFRAWVYGMAWLGIFSGASLVARAPSRARALCVGLMFSLWVGHDLCQSSTLTAQLPGLEHLVWLFPAQYADRLWSPRWMQSVPAVLALLALGALGFAIGQALFRRSDA